MVVTGTIDIVGVLVVVLLIVIILYFVRRV
jgi:hypothetical protein